MVRKIWLSLLLLDLSIGALAQAASRKVTTDDPVIRPLKRNLVEMNGAEELVEPAITVQQDVPKFVLPSFGDPKVTVVGPVPTNLTSRVGAGVGGGVGADAESRGGGRGGYPGGNIPSAVKGVTAPELIHQVDPVYPRNASHAKYQGTVILRAIIDQSGHARNIQIVHGLGMGLDESAKDALRQWVFRPALKNGHPVAVLSNFEFNFKLHK